MGFSWDFSWDEIWILWDIQATTTITGGVGLCGPNPILDSQFSELGDLYMYNSGTLISISSAN